MAKAKHKVKCASCGRQFTVTDPSTALPKHPARKEARHTGIPVACDGSGLPGVPLVKPSIKPPTKPTPSKEKGDNLT